MRRRAELPGASELFRTTAPRTAEPPAQPQPGEPPDDARPRSGSGRRKHDAKITVYVSDEELLALEQARLALRAEHGIDDRAHVIGVLGRLDPNKRFDLVIESAAPLLGEGAKLLVVGGGAERENLEALAANLGVAEHVVFAGERHDVSAMLSALDLFVASSKQETFGLSVLEALANGMPVLYTTCPALEGVRTDRARQVPGDVDGMREALAAEVTDRRPRGDVPAIRELYGIEAVTGRIDDLYERLRTGGGRAARPLAAEQGRGAR